MGKRIAVCTVAFEEERFITGCIKQFRGLVDAHIVLHSSISWAGVECQDRTKELAEEAGATVVSMAWDTEAEQRNFGQSILSEFDWILVVDADERYTQEDAKKLVDFLETAEADAYGMGRVITYWRDWEHCVEPEESPGLIVAVKPHVSFTYLRCIDSDWRHLPKDIVTHHGSYIRTDSEMHQKVTNFGHAHEIQPTWYEDKWIAWGDDNDIRDLHPVYPEIFNRIVSCERVIQE